MTFKVSRTSDCGFNKNDPPCKNAVATVEEYEFRRCIFDKNGKQIWQSTPCTRDIWTIEINTLEELMELKKEVDEEADYKNGLIIFTSKDKMPEIEIYDDYRE